MSKVTIITGGTSGIGRGIAEKILENSASDDILYVSYGHNTEQAEEFLHAQTEENQKKIRLLQADMSSYDEMMKFVSRIKEEASHVDWLVNNVGISTYAKYEDYTFDEWTKIVNTNLSVPVFLVKALNGYNISKLWELFCSGRFTDIKSGKEKRTEEKSEVK